MIFFNVPEARDHLMKNGLVYTLRKASRSTGVTRAVVGNYTKHTTLCQVHIGKMKTVSHPDELLPFLSSSGFEDVKVWWSKAEPTARTVYRVEKYG